jgi:type I restriction enzyme, R subunit
MYSILQGQELDPTAEDTHPEELTEHRWESVSIAYSKKVPPEFFDLIIIDECHHSIYNLLGQVLSYFDSFLVGLTATHDIHTYSFFEQNVVSDFHDSHLAQILGYLSITALKTALLLNFKYAKLGIKRVSA